jgi:two-component system, response regulator YesN
VWSVMLVDDEQTVLEGLRDFVDWATLDAQVVATLTSGREALAAFAELRPDIVVTDVYMPGLDGLELIREIAARDADTSFVVLSGYDEFDYARRALQVGAIDYLLKPATVDEITAVLAKAVERCRETSLKRRLEASLPLLREQFLLHLLREPPDPEEARFLGLERLLAGPYAVALTAIERPAGLTEEEWQLLCLVARTVAEEDGVHALPYAGGEMPILLHQPTRPAEWCETLLQRLESRLSAAVTIGVSRTCADVRTAYSEAREALAYREMLGNSRVIRVDRLGLADTVPAYQVERNRQVLEALRLGDGEGVRRLAIDALAALRDAPLPYARAVCFELYGLAAMALAERGESIEEIHPHAEFWGRIATVDSLDELSAWTEGWLVAAAHRLNVRRDDRHERMLEAVDRIIAERYAEDLTLVGVARQVFLSRAYVAYLFKQRRGISFLEHLTNVRMDRAREMLLTTDAPVYEVAERVGYRNPAYFSRLFHEQFGMKPSELKWARQAVR